MKEAEVGRFSAEFGGNSETHVAQLVDMSHKDFIARTDTSHRVGSPREQVGLAGLI